MYEALKSIAEANDWFFMYARDDYRNLHDDENYPDADNRDYVFNEDGIANGIVHIFLDPVKRGYGLDEMGQPEVNKYSGYFTIVYSSDYDKETYQKRYDDYIKPLLDEAVVTITEGLVCSDVTLTFWSSDEIINDLDFNFDGLLVTYNAES